MLDLEVVWVRVLLCYVVAVAAVEGGAWIDGRDRGRLPRVWVDDSYKGERLAGRGVVFPWGCVEVRAEGGR